MSGFQQLSQTSGYRTADAQKRTMSIKNMADEEIPGFAACVLRHGDTVSKQAGGNTIPLYNQEVVEGQVVWHVYKPTSKEAGKQNPAMIIINGPTPIPKGGMGTGSQDWPLQVSHELSNRLGRGVVCGVVDGSWDVNTEGNDFVCMSNDKAVILGDKKRNTV